MKCAGVAVAAANYSFDAEFDYIIPVELTGIARPGCRVTVPFGKGNKKTLGIIYGLKERNDCSKLKKILSVIDETPLLDEKMLELARFVKDRTFCTLYEAAKVMIPAGIEYKMVRSYIVNPGADEDAVKKLTGPEAEFYGYLEKRGVYVKGDNVFKNLGMVPDYSVPAKLVKKELIFEKDDAIKKLGDLTKRMMRLIPSETEIKLTAKQKEMADILNDVGTASVRELCYFTGSTPAVANALVKNGAAEFFDSPVNYFQDFSDTDGERTEINLTPEQEKAFSELCEAAFSGKRETALLYGVTGSGKTSVYMSVIDKVIDDGKNVIFLVPEIGLTPQALGIFCRRYGRDIAVFHSALSVRERSEQWKKVKSGRAKIIIGTRSAIFAPIQNIGLIIIDEEQEHTYKSEKTPRYDAADVAKFRAAQNNCLLILASATPRVETYAAALDGKYRISVLRNRYGNAIMPKVLTVDMRTAEKMPACREISRELYEAVNLNIEAGKQSILLINRRGYNTFAVCDNCNEVITCPNCSISMTYHIANKRLMCHYCGYSLPVTCECPSCHEQSVRYAGYGTQKIEDELQSLFPDARILRMDADTTTAKDSHERLFSAFEKGEYDILIGTQMVAKGLDFPNVTLVGVISIDQQLYNDDFRSMEKTFSLLTQVIGRSGRGSYEGSAIIQTITPENEIIQIAARQDYDEFYGTEIKIRKGMIYPPYCDLCVIGINGSNEGAVKLSAVSLITALREMTGGAYKNEKIIVLGPAPARVAKVGGKFRYRIIIKCHNTKSFRQMISEVLINSETDPKFRNVTVYADINPDTIL